VTEVWPCLRCSAYAVRVFPSAKLVRSCPRRHFKNSKNRQTRARAQMSAKNPKAPSVNWRNGARRGGIANSLINSDSSHADRTGAPVNCAPLTAHSKPRPGPAEVGCASSSTSSATTAPQHMICPPSSGNQERQESVKLCRTRSNSLSLLAPSHRGPAASSLPPATCNQFPAKRNRFPSSTASIPGQPRLFSRECAKHVWSGCSNTALVFHQERNFPRSDGLGVLAPRCDHVSC